MKTVDYLELSVSRHLTGAIINGTAAGVEKEDREDVRAFLARWSDVDYFTVDYLKGCTIGACDVTGLTGTVVAMRAYYFKG